MAVYRDQSSLKLLLGIGGLLCTSCCPPDTCAGFGSVVDVVVAGVTRCGSTSYSENCGVADPLDIASLLGDPNGTFRLTYGSFVHPVLQSPTFHLVSGDWIYAAYCEDSPNRWTVFVAPVAYTALNAFLATFALVDIAKPNSYTSSSDCGVGNCEDAFGRCGYGGAATIEFVP